jgi:hypothetical protein
MCAFSPAPIIVAKTRRIFRRFEDAGATSPGNARTIEELDLYHGLIFSRLLKQGVIIEATPQRYYLNRENLLDYSERRKFRKTIILAIFAILVIIGVIYSFFAKP